jgi:hypothetical protein
MKKLVDKTTVTVKLGLLGNRRILVNPKSSRTTKIPL